MEVMGMWTVRRREWVKKMDIRHISRREGRGRRV
jgi:hypothetical protein